MIDVRAGALAIGTALAVAAPAAAGPPESSRSTVAALAAAPAPPPARLPARPVPLPPPPRRQPPPRPAYLVGELGMEMASRKLGYSGAGSGTGLLLAFDVPVIWSPRLRLEGFPLAGLASPALAGLGLHADWTRSVGLKTEVAGTASKIGTTATRLLIGLLWRSPSLGWGVRVVPSLGAEWASVVASPAIAGLPDAHLRGLRAGAGLEVPLAGGVSALAGLALQRWLTAKDLVGAGFFPGGSAWGLEGELGAEVHLAGPLAARGVLDYRSTRYSLKGDAAGVWVASGATDRSLGFRVMARAAW